MPMLTTFLMRRPAKPVLAVDLDRVALVEVAERGVEDGAPLGRVDLLAREHLLDLFLEIRLLRELDEGLHDLFVDAVLRVVERPARGLDGEFRGSRLVLREQFLDRLLRGRGHRHVQLRPLVFSFGHFLSFVNVASCCSCCFAKIRFQALPAAPRDQGQAYATRAAWRRGPWACARDTPP